MILSYNELPMDLTGRMKDYPNLWKSNYNSVDKDFEFIAMLVKSDYRCYSAGVFKDGYAKDDNWQYQDLIIFDIDEGLTLSEAKSLFGTFDGIIATTRSHQKEKNGIVCDRFRVIIRASQRIQCTKQEYKDAISFIMEYDYPFVDKACKDVSRIFFGTSNSEIHYLSGLASFDFNSRIYKANKLKEIEAWKHSKKQAVEVRHDGTKADWYRENWKTEKILKAINFYERFGQGGRNHALYAWGKYFKDDIKLTDYEVKDILLWINSMGDSLDEKEVRATVFKSLRINNG